MKEALWHLFDVRRLDHNLRDYFIRLQGLMCIISVLPFAFYRLLCGDFVIALMDLGIVVCLVLSAWLVSFSKKEAIKKLVSYSFSAVYFCGILGIISLSGPSSILWVFPVSIVCFMILPAWFAGIYSAALWLLLIFFMSEAFDISDMVLVFTTYFVTCWMAFILAAKIHYDRKSIENAACYDVLTGAKTRHVLFKDIQQALAEANVPLSLLAFDIDHFKSINDSLGHSTGDRVLKRVVRLANSSLSEEQGIYRFGGEEFFILVHINENDAYTLAETMRLAQQSDTNSIIEEQVTLSFGVAQWRTGESLESLIKRTDAALYESKHAGRNCTSIAP